MWKEAKGVANSGRLNYIEGMLTNLADGTYKGNAAAAIFYAKNAAPDEFKDKRDIDINSTSNITYIIDTGIPALPSPGKITEAIVEAEFTEILEEEQEPEEEMEGTEEEEFDL